MSRFGTSDRDRLTERDRTGLRFPVSTRVTMPTPVFIANNYIQSSVAMARLLYYNTNQRVYQQHSTNSNWDRSGIHYNGAASSNNLIKNKFSSQHRLFCRCAGSSTGLVEMDYRSLYSGLTWPDWGNSTNVADLLAWRTILL